jgi:hypothetical protein
LLHPFRSRGFAVVAWVALAAPVPAQALIESFTLVPAQSFLQLDAESGFTIELGGGPLFAPFATQVGVVPGATGAAVPGIGPSDGLRTSLSGTVRTDVTPTQISIQSGGTAVTPGHSGTWAPGAPANPNALAPASLAVSFAFPSLDLAGTAALRGTAFSMNAAPTNRVAQTATSWTFAAFPLFSVLGGVIDFDTNLASIGGRGFFDETRLLFGGQQNGLLEDLGGGLLRLTMPFDVTITLASEELGNAPVAATIALSGRIVGYNRPIPEPSAALLLTLGGVGLGLARRAPRGGR